MPTAKDVAPRATINKSVHSAATAAACQRFCDVFVENADLLSTSLFHVP
jgi:hypothetical protein